MVGDNTACSRNPITPGQASDYVMHLQHLLCVESLSEEFPISQGSMRKALISVHLPGRLQVLQSAHNSS